MEALIPISREDPNFSGVIEYTRTFDLSQAPPKAYISFEHIYEVMRLWINGHDAGRLIEPPYQMEIAGFLQCGENTIRVEVATTLHRDQQNFSQPVHVDLRQKAMEPTGMYGRVWIGY